MNASQLFQKYTTAGPRYTSYPTVPFWQNEQFTSQKYQSRLLSTFAKEKQHGIAVYIHLPYCESLCTFCACHKRITKNHAVEDVYIDALLLEWAHYVQLLGEKPTIKELHIGGGTPSFFHPDQIKRLLAGIFALSKEGILTHGSTEYSWEGHPMNTTEAHLATFYEAGFRRVSFGVQDYDETVQKAIHRIQPFEKVKEVTEMARRIGYSSISHDLVFGLPFQTPAGIQKTIERTLTLAPDRLSFYSYAHVPWLKGTGQRGFQEADIPVGKEKRHLYDIGLALFQEAGYQEIGMDHFALTDDPMLLASKNGTLHRNFMGYTTSQAKVMISLGASSIGDAWTGFVQNTKDIDLYIQQVQMGEFPWSKGHIHTEKESQIRKIILDIMCQWETNWHAVDWEETEKERIELALEDMQNDGILEQFNGFVRVTENGKPFIRNICMVFDPTLHQNTKTEKLFSATI